MMIPRFPAPRPPFRVSPSDPPTPAPGSRWRAVAAACVWTGWFATLSPAAVAASGTPSAAARSRVGAPSSIRMGIAPGTWQGLNRNDASAAISAWTKNILKQRGMDISVEVVTLLFDSTDELAAALAGGRVDCVSMLSDQFLDLDPALRPRDVFLAVSNNSTTDRYVLLVHHRSGITDTTGLAGRRLMLHDTARTSIALPWLDGLLADRSLGLPEVLFSEVGRVEKPSKALLPVFFGQADSCLVTSNAFAVAKELNPQLGRELRVLAVSPEVISTMFFFRSNYASEEREVVEGSILTMHETQTGLQALTVFQAQRMLKQPAAIIETVREVLARSRELRRTHARR